MVPLWRLEAKTKMENENIEMENENTENYTTTQLALSALAVGAFVYVPAWAGHALVSYGAPLSILGYALYAITLISVIAASMTIRRPIPLWSKAAHIAMLVWSSFGVWNLVS